jgi:hypothetical protein
MLTASSALFVEVRVVTPVDVEVQGAAHTPSGYPVPLGDFATPRIDCLPGPELIWAP